MLLSFDSYVILEKSKIDYEDFLHQNESDVVSDLFGTAGVAALAAGVGGAEVKLNVGQLLQVHVDQTILGGAGFDQHLPVGA